MSWKDHNNNNQNVRGDPDGDWAWVVRRKDKRHGTPRPEERPPPPVKPPQAAPVREARREEAPPPPSPLKEPERYREEFPQVDNSYRGRGGYPARGRGGRGRGGPPRGYPRERWAPPRNYPGRNAQRRQSKKEEIADLKQRLAELENTPDEDPQRAKPSAGPSKPRKEEKAPWEAEEEPVDNTANSRAKQAVYNAYARMRMQSPDNFSHPDPGSHLNVLMSMFREQTDRNERLMENVARLRAERNEAKAEVSNLSRKLAEERKRRPSPTVRRNRTRSRSRSRHRRRSPSSSSSESSSSTSGDESDDRRETVKKGKRKSSSGGKYVRVPHSPPRKKSKDGKGVKKSKAPPEEPAVNRKSEIPDTPEDDKEAEEEDLIVSDDQREDYITPGQRTPVKRKEKKKKDDDKE